MQGFFSVSQLQQDLVAAETRAAAAFAECSRMHEENARLQHELRSGRNSLALAEMQRDRLQVHSQEVADTMAAMEVQAAVSKRRHEQQVNARLGQFFLVGVVG